MKSFCIIFLLSLISFAKTDKGIFKFNEETHDFGRIPVSHPVVYTFTFENIGQKPIIIFDVKPVCGCTIAAYTKLPVKKNGKGFVKVTFHAVTKEGFNKAIVVTSNTDTPTKYLTIKGEVY